MNEQLLTVEEAATRLNVSVATARRWCASGKLLAKRVGRGWVIDVNALPKTRRSPPRRKATTASGIVNMSLSIKELATEDLRRNVWVPDVLRFEDDLAKPDFIFNAAALRLDRVESFDPPITVPVPKSPFFVRNAVNLTLPDRLAYHAAVAVAAPLVEKVTSEAVFSARLSPEPNRFLEAGTNAWVRWKAAVEKAVLASDGWMIETDVTAFFDCISHTILVQDLQRLGCPTPIVDAIRDGLRQWSAAPNTGIPQGPDGSRVLGNFYMVAIDDVMLAILGISYFRYMDDIRIVAEKKHVAVEALHVLGAECLRRNLYLSTKKTALHKGQEAVDSMTDRLIDDAAYAFDHTLDGKDLRDQLCKLFKAALGKSGLDTRRAKFSIYRLRALREDGVLRLALRRLEDLAPLGQLVPLYVLPWLRRPAAGRDIASYLVDPERNTSDFLSTWLLAAFLDEPRAITSDILSYARQVAFGRSNSSYHRAIALNVVALGGVHRDLAQVGEVIRKEFDPEVVRAAVVALARVGALDKPAIAAAARISGMDATLDYLKGRTELPSLVLHGARVPTGKR
jgi:excisionase family DNA binding protein